MYLLLDMLGYTRYRIYHTWIYLEIDTYYVHVPIPRRTYIILCITVAADGHKICRGNGKTLS